jgi:ArsR family transcriptional regulator
MKADLAARSDGAWVFVEDDLLAERLQALAHPARLALWRVLLAHGNDGVPAGEVAESLGLAPNALSFHLDRLRQVGLITVRRSGRQRIYAPSLPAMRSLIERLGETCCRSASERCGEDCPGDGAGGGGDQRE